MVKDKNLVIRSEDTIFNKIINFFKKKIFKESPTEKIVTRTNLNENNRKKEKFLDNISLKDDIEERYLIEKVEKNPDLLNSMTTEEIDKLNEALKHQQNILDKKIEQLENDISIQKRLNKS